VARDGPFRHSHAFRRLINGKTAEESQLDDQGLQWIDLFEILEGLAHRNNVFGLRSQYRLHCFQRYALLILPASFLPPVPASVIDEGSTHERSNQPEEMNSILPIDFLPTC